MTDTETPIEDLVAISQEQPQGLPAHPALADVEALIEKCRDQKVSVQELQILILRRYVRKNPEWKNRKADVFGPTISERKWRDIRALSNKLISNMDRRIALLEKLRAALAGERAS